MKKSFHLISALFIGLSLISFSVLTLIVETTLTDFYLPGSQDYQSGNIETPNKCDNCHGGYDKTVEPAFNWRGSMMAQAMRDPMFLAAFAIANQEVDYAGDLCIRCHSPAGWLSGHSVPTDGSLLNKNDYQGVQCDFCHKLVKPANIGINPFEGDSDYLSQTYLSDQEYLAILEDIPSQSGNGMYIAHDSNSKRGPFVNVAARHNSNYSPFHSEANLCGSCHDVSNPVFEKVVNLDGTVSYVLNQLDTRTPSFDTHTMFPNERTYSEWTMSAFNTPDGISIPGMGGNKATVSTCQDCHMPDVSGYGANKPRTPFRHNLPLHDMTGGNTFVPKLVSELYPDDVDHEALLKGIERATYMLQNAAVMEVIPVEKNGGYSGATVKITNNTGHKLPSGYPEGRRMWIQVVAYDEFGNEVFTSGYYDYDSAELELEGDPKIYEAKLAMSPDVEALSGQQNDEDGTSFHFALNNIVVKDNRIPPRGFNNENFKSIQSPPIDVVYEDGQYWDNTAYYFGDETAYKIEVKLLYQTTSKEYATFLKEANVTTNDGDIFYALWESNGKSAPIIMEEVVIEKGVIPSDDIPVFVKNIEFSRVYTPRRGGRTLLTAVVTVVDENNNLIPDALVKGQFSGPTSSNVHDVTNEFGEVVFTTSTRYANENWCLVITDIEKEGYEFTSSYESCEDAQRTIVKNGKYGVKVYPNPADDFVSINLNVTEKQNVKIEVFNYSGELVKSLNKIKSQHDDEIIDIPISDLPAGIYLIRIVYNHKTETRVIQVI